MSVEDDTLPHTPLLDALSPTYFRLFVAVIDEKANLAYKDQCAENGAFAADFTTLAGNSDLAPLDAGITMDGYVAILAQQNGAQDLMYYTENRGDSGQRFADPVNLGRPAAISAFQMTSLIRGLDGLPNVFGIANDQSIWWRYQNTYTVGTETIEVVPPGTTTPVEVTASFPMPPAEPWSDWIQIPGALETVTAANNADGRLILVGLNADKVAYLNVQSSTDPFTPEAWDGWTDISGELSGFAKIAIAFDGNERIYVFASIGANIYKKAQTQTGVNSFTDWVLFASFDETISDFAIGMGANGGLYVAAQVGSGDNSPVYGIRQTGGNPAVWSAPKVIARLAGSNLLNLHAQANGQLLLFAQNVDAQTLQYVVQLMPDHWSATWTALGSGIASYAVSVDITPNAD